MRASVALLAGLLVACGPEPDPAADNYGWGWHYDEIGASGLRLRYEPEVPADRRRDMAAFEAAWTETAACYGHGTPSGPLVIVTAGAVACEHPDVCVGLAYFATRTVVVHAGLAALRHEYVHILRAHPGHDDPAFDTCGQAGPEATWPSPFPALP